MGNQGASNSVNTLGPVRKCFSEERSLSDWAVELAPPLFKAFLKLDLYASLPSRASIRLPTRTRINDRTSSNELIVTSRTVKMMVSITNVRALLVGITRPVISIIYNVGISASMFTNALNSPIDLKLLLDNSRAARNFSTCIGLAYPYLRKIKKRAVFYHAFSDMYAGQLAIHHSLLRHQDSAYI